MKLSEALKIFLIARMGEGYSPNTLRYYKIYLHRVCDFLDDPDITDVTTNMLIKYMAWLQTAYKTKPFNNCTDPISPVIAVSNWSAIHSFFSWVNETMQLTRPDLNLKRPKYKRTEVEPYTKDELLALLEAAEHSKFAKTVRRQSWKTRRPTRLRDKSIILLLMDTGMRVSELCRLKMGDLILPCNENLKPENGYIHIKPPTHSSKTIDRLVPISTATLSEIMTKT
jgi:integrase/recombinase XerD